MRGSMKEPWAPGDPVEVEIDGAIFLGRVIDPHVRYQGEFRLMLIEFDFNRQRGEYSPRRCSRPE